MAEIRKHNEKADGLAAAVRAAIGGDLRPVTPGEPAAEEKDVSDQPLTVLTVPFLTKGAESFLLPQSMSSAANNDSLLVEDGDQEG